MSVPSHFLNSCQVVLVVGRPRLSSLLVHAVFAICDRLLKIGVLHRYLLELLMLGGSSLALDPDPLQLKLVLAFALFALLLLSLSLSKLFLLVGLALFSHFLAL